MSWFQKIFKDSREKDVCRLFSLRSTRFRQLLRNYGRILDRQADAAEKQAGEYILDRQYIVSLVEVVIDLAESIIFDLNVITDNRFYSFYDILKKLDSEARDALSSNANMETSADRRISAKPEAGVSARVLAEAIGRSPVLFRNEGQAACRGVATGAVFNLETAENASAFPDGAVMVAADIRPDDELIRVMRKASAILTDFGEPAGDTAILAREFQIPMIVGLQGVSSLLETGSIVTVDADECTVYPGRIQELLDYYRVERPTSEEEPEYKLLRKLRQLMFRLTLMEGSEGQSAGQECKSVHDLVHLASELAGDALVELANSRDSMSAYTEIPIPYPISLRVLDVGDGIMQPAPDAGRPDLEKVRSLPLLAFLNGFKEVDRHGAQSMRSDLQPATLLATIKEEHANILILTSGGSDIVDSSIGESKESSHIYCRFAVGGIQGTSPGARGAMTREILSRLNFAVAQTPRASSAWISGLPVADMNDRLAIVGRLSAFLGIMDATKGESRALDAIVEDFMAQYA
jgi:pyruvate,water dikinase